MPYISGLNNKDGKIIIINESDWSIEAVEDLTASPDDGYEITELTAGQKLVAFRRSTGEIEAYGNVTATADPVIKVLGTTDSSSNSHTWTTGTDANFLGEPYFQVGKSSLLLNGTSDGYIAASASSSQNLGTVFTVSFWMRIIYSSISNPPEDDMYDHTGGYMMEYYDTGTGGIKMIMNITGQIGAYYYDNTNTQISSLMANQGPDLRDNVWHHIAWVRDGINFYLFIDGQSTHTDASSNPSATAVHSTPPSALYIGRNTAGNSRIAAEFDEVEFINGTAKWTTNFLLPETESESTANHNDLLHMNDDDSVPVDPHGGTWYEATAGFGNYWQSVQDANWNNTLSRWEFSGLFDYSMTLKPYTASTWANGFRPNYMKITGLFAGRGNSGTTVSLKDTGSSTLGSADGQYEVYIDLTFGASNLQNLELFGFKYVTGIYFDVDPGDPGAGPV